MDDSLEAKEYTTRRTLRGRVSTFGLAVIGGWLLLLTIGFNVVLVERLHQQTTQSLTARAESVAATVNFGPNRTMTVGESSSDSVLDSGVWVYFGPHALERPPGNAALQQVADGLVNRGSQFADGPESTRLYALPIRRDGRQVGTVVVSTSLSAAQNTSRTALWGSAALAILVLAGAYPVLRASAARALRPVDAMTAQAADWSAHAIGQRFGRHQHFRELQSLAHHLDGVLDHLSAVVRHERQLPAELSHELRTPLSRIAAETELLLARPRTAQELSAAHTSIRDATRSMQRILDTLLTTAQAESREAPGRSEIAPVIARLTALHTPARVTLRSEISPADLVTGVEAAVLERILSPILENALRYAAQAVTLTAEVREGVVAILVTDDGVGIPPHLREQIFLPGIRHDSGDAHPGAGLGLALARRLARAADGNVTVASAVAPCTFRVDLPSG